MDFEYTKVAKLSKDDLIMSLPVVSDLKTIKEKEALFVRKLQLCSIIFNFPVESPPGSGSGSINMKTKKMDRDALPKARKCQYLEEMIEAITQSNIILTTTVTKEIIAMAKKNIFRSLPPPLFDNYDEDDIFIDPQWRHLELVYELFYEFLLNVEINTVLRNKCLTNEFLLAIINLFRSEESREREFLKIILHRIYSRFIIFRSFIRKSIHNILYQTIYENEQHHGIAELLEILGSVVEGFGVPLKREHKKFLRHVLIPLHKVKTLNEFHEELSYCVSIFIQKDPTLTWAIINGILNFWPKISATKQVLFLEEMEELLMCTNEKEFQTIIEPLFKKLAVTICSPHYKISQQTLLLWNNDQISTLIVDNREKILPIIYPSLSQNAANHWNKNIFSLSIIVSHSFLQLDPLLFNRVRMDYEAKLSLAENDKKLKVRQNKWEKIRALTKNRNSSIVA